MTSYSYNITFNVSEMIMLREALNHYAKHCRGHLKAGPVAPYWAHLHSIEGIERQIAQVLDATHRGSFDGRPID